MPNRHYVPSGGSWPTWVDRALAHMNELGLSVISFVVGVLTFLEVTKIGAVVDSHISLTIHKLPLWVGYTLSISLLLGSSLVIFSTLRTFKDRITYWAILRTGLLLEFIGWFAYTFSVYFLTPPHSRVVPLTVIIGFVVLKLGRFARTLLDEYRLKLRKVNLEKKGYISDEPQ